jgi:hypothetical protein
MPSPAPQACRAAAGCGISDLWARSSAQPGPQYPKLPPFIPTQSPPDRATKACQGGDPQTFTISAWPHPLGLHRPARSLLHGALPLRTAKPAIHTCTISVLLGCAPQACTGLHDVHWDLAPKACQASNPQTRMISTPPGLCPSGTPGPCSKGLLVCLNKRPPPVGLWDPTHLPPATGGLQTFLRDTHRQVWMLKE